MAVKRIVVSNMGRTHIIEQNIPAQVENPQYVWVNLDESSKYDEQDIFRAIYLMDHDSRRRRVQSYVFAMRSKLEEYVDDPEIEYRYRYHLTEIELEQMRDLVRKEVLALRATLTLDGVMTREVVLNPKIFAYEEDEIRASQFKNKVLLNILYVTSSVALHRPITLSQFTGKDDNPQLEKKQEVCWDLDPWNDNCYNGWNREP